MSRASGKWKKGIILLASASLAAAASVTSAELNLNQTGAAQAVVTVSCTFGAGTDGDLAVAILGTSDGTNFDLIEGAEVKSISSSASGAVRKTFKVSGYPSVKIMLTNGNTAEAVTIAIDAARMVWEQ